MKDEVVKLIQQADLDEALKVGQQYLKTSKDFYYDLLILQSRFEDKEKDKRNGVISNEEYTIDINRISLDYLDLVQKIDDSLHTDNYITSSINTFLERIQHILASRYNIKEVLAEGASTVMFKAMDLYARELVVIKALKIENLTSETKAFENVETLRDIRHRNIIEIKSMSQPRTSPSFVVLKYVNGGDLYEIIKENGRRTEHETRALMVKICDALYHLHKRKIFHADLRASRILIDDENEPVISPFSVFRTNSYNNFDQIIANLRFMSYERLSSKSYNETASSSSNQFSLGILGFFLLTGEELFNGDTLVDLMEDRYKFQNDEQYRAEKLALLQCQDEFKTIITKLLSPIKKDRYQNILVVKEQLQDIEFNLAPMEQIAFESYSRACSYNSTLTADFISILQEQKLMDIDPTIDPSQLAMRLHHIINLIIESDDENDYLSKVMESKNMQLFFQSSYKQVFPVFLSLMEKSDYLWSKDVEASWQAIFEKTFKVVGEQ
jgi:serine/threonine protein kinase